MLMKKKEEIRRKKIEDLCRRIEINIYLIQFSICAYVLYDTLRLRFARSFVSFSFFYFSVKKNKNPFINFNKDMLYRYIMKIK